MDKIKAMTINQDRYPATEDENIIANSQQRERFENVQREPYVDQDKLVIPVVEEKAFVGKKVVETGKVRISKRVNEYEETIDEPIFHEQVSVERIPVNQFVDSAPQVRQEGEMMIIPVVEERVVVEKRLFVVEELHVRKQVLETHAPQTVTLRKEEVEINRIAADDNLGDHR